MSAYATGWVNDPLAVQSYLQFRAKSGDTADVMTAKPALDGFWRQIVGSGLRCVLLYQAEEEVLGHFLPAIFQRRGTCVMQGTFRAIETSYFDALAERRITGRRVQVASETIYPGGRVNVGKGQLGPSHPWGCNCERCPDGLVGAWAAKYVHGFGVIPRGVYGSIDLSQPREDLAIAWAAPDRGVPRELLALSQAYRCDAYHVPTAEALADVTAARFASAICSTHQQSDRRDDNGECGYIGSTAHCEAITGVYVRSSWDGNPATLYEHTGFVDQQSWGQIPGGPDVLRYFKGSAKLREGAYGTPLPAMRKRMATGETWAFRMRDGFRAKSLTESI